MAHAERGGQIAMRPTTESFDRFEVLIELL